MAEPSCGPSGGQVAEFVRPAAAQMLGMDPGALAGLTLEELAQRVVDQDADRLQELRVRASEAADFRGLTPGFGHEAAALLLREGAVKLITVNWDCGIEGAGAGMGVVIEHVVHHQESTQSTDALIVYKVHGCATQPPTLAMTKDEVDKPPEWVVARTQGALADSVVVFVGLGTVGLYVSEPIESLVEIWSKEASVLVADPNLSPAWEEALGADKAAESHVKCNADCFFDDLLRALVLDALTLGDQEIQGLPEEDWATAMRVGFAELRKGLEAACADGVIRWWRDGVTPSESGKAFIGGQNGRWSMMAVGLLVGEDGVEVEVGGARGRQTVASEKRFFEIVSRPGRPISEVEREGRHRIRRRYDEGVYGQKKPVSVVVPGAIGRFPASGAHADISAGEAEMTDIAEGVDVIPIHFVSAEEAVQGRLGV